MHHALLLSLLFLHQPSVSRNDVAFVYANQIWIAPRRGGAARQLTTTPAAKFQPRFSPDGARVAFNDTVNILTISLKGGDPERVTYLPSQSTLTQWTADDKLIFYTNALSFSRIEMQLYAVPSRGGLPKQLPPMYGSQGAIDETGEWLAYTAQWPNSLIARWRGYRGGMAPDVVLMNLRTGTRERVTTWEGSDVQPMWRGRTIYYLSDAGPEQRMNLWSYDTQTRARRQLTKFGEYDVRSASMGPDAIAFEYGGDLYLYDLSRGSSSKIDIRITRRPSLVRDVHVSVSNELTEARGDLWIGARNLTMTSGAFEREAARSPDKKWIAYMSDASGQYELYVREAGGAPRQLTHFANGFRYRPAWSPDSRKLAFSDQTGTTYLCDLEGKLTRVGKDRWSERPELAFSADSQWLAYSRTAENRVSALWRYDIASGKSAPLTSSRYNAALPAFGAKHFFFLSNRDFTHPVYDWIGQRVAHRATGVLMMVPLDGALDADAIESRAVRIPTSIGSISTLELTPEGNPRYTITDTTGATTTRVYDLAAKRESEVPAVKSESIDATVRVDLRAEWQQVFNDVVRLYRDFFYAPKAGARDWTAIARRYQPLLGRCETREDVNEVLAAFIGESGIGHAYLGNAGDVMKSEPAPAPGMPGADFELVGDVYRVTRVIEGAPWDDTARSPFRDVHPGEFLFAVDGKPVDPSRDPRAAFVGFANKPVTVRVGATRESARDLVITPLANEWELRDRRWVEDNRARVEALSGGRTGYIHLNDFSTNGVNELARQLYAQLDKESLVVDIRWSMGGWSGAVATEMLRRPALNFAGVRDSDKSWPALRWGAHFGPKVLLVNHMVASAGENFSYYFRKSGVGPVIGTRTWGGLTGLNPVPALIDGGAVNIPNAPFFDENGWIVEGRGVDPDLVIDSVVEGEDAQLEAAVKAVNR